MKGTNLKTAYQLYMRDIEKIKPLSKVAEEKYFTAWRKHNNENARQTIYRSNLRLVVKIAHRYKNQGIDILEIINEGNLGLNLAMKRFDHTKGLKFISYAVWYIRQAMLELLARQSRFVAITGAEAVFKANLNKAGIKLMQKLDREPTELELAKETGFAVERVRHMEFMLKNSSTTSIDTKLRDSYGKTTIGDTIPDNKFGSPETPDNMTEAVLTLFDQAHLDEQEKNVLASYFGIAQSARNLEEISFDYNLSRERMRQVKEKALETLHGFIKRSKKLNIPNAIVDIL